MPDSLEENIRWQRTITHHPERGVASDKVDALGFLF